MPENESSYEIPEDPVLVRLGLKRNQVSKGLGTQRSRPAEPPHKKKALNPGKPETPAPPAVVPDPLKRPYKKREKKAEAVEPETEKVERIDTLSSEPPIVTTPEKIEMLPVEEEGSFFPDSTATE